jgi:hypothetical protein
MARPELAHFLFSPLFSGRTYHFARRAAVNGIPAQSTLARFANREP